LPICPKVRSAAAPISLNDKPDNSAIYARNPLTLHGTLAACRNGLRLVLPCAARVFRGRPSKCVDGLCAGWQNDLLRLSRLQTSFDEQAVADALQMSARLRGILQNIAEATLGERISAVVDAAAICGGDSSDRSTQRSNFSFHQRRFPCRLRSTFATASSESDFDRLIIIRAVHWMRE
jgi:hypothetical protein